MKQSIIQQILHGKRGRHEVIKTTKKQSELLDVFAEKDERFRERVRHDEELFTLYDELIETMDNMLGEESNSFFTEGFKLGLLVGIEAMEG